MHGTDGQSAAEPYTGTLAARRQTSNNAHSLLVLHAVRRQQRARAVYVILAIFEC